MDEWKEYKLGGCCTDVKGRKIPKHNKFLNYCK